MRFFSYISDAKVDMLLPQIPARKKKSIAAELGFNVGVLSGKIHAESQTLDTRVSRLLAVEKYIRANELLGSADNPDTWIEGSRLFGCAVCIETGALLWACQGDHWLLALAGSAIHSAGAAPIEARMPYSSMAGVMHLVSNNVLPHFDGAESWPRERNVYNARARQGTFWLRDLVDYVLATCRHQAQPMQEISFIARRLLSKPLEGKLLVLASPLYVELSS